MVFTKKKSETVNAVKPGADGKYVFGGDHYLFRGEYKSHKARVLILSFASAALWIFGGCIPAPGMMNCFWVIIPYFIALLISLGALLWASFRMIFYGERLRDYVYRATVQSIPKRSVAAVICAAASFAAGTVFIIIYGTGDRAVFAVLELVSTAAVAVLAYFLGKTVKAGTWEKETVTRDN